MSFTYDPASHSCRDPARGITAEWAGGGGGAGNESRGFRFRHADWGYTPSFYVEERDIFRTVETGDLSRNEVRVTETFGAHPVVVIGPHTPGAVVAHGDLPPLPTLRAILHDGIACLYSEGGRCPIRVEGLLAGRRAKRR